MNGIHLKEFVERIFAEKERAQDTLDTERQARIDERFAAVERARETALANMHMQMQTALETQAGINIKQNEFRGALNDQAQRVERDMLPRKEYDVQHVAVRNQIDAVEGEMRRSTDQTRGDVATMQLAFDKQMATIREEMNKAFAEIRQEMIEGPRRQHLIRLQITISAVIAAAAVVTIVVLILTHS